MLQQAKLEWSIHKFQIVGAVILLFAFFLAFVNAIWVTWGLLAVVGLIDLYLIWYLKQMTITKWIRLQFPKYVDTIIIFALIVLVWRLKSEVTALWFVFGLLNSHFFEEQ